MANQKARSRMEESKANRPFHEIRSSNLKCTIWANETSNGRMFNTLIVRVYRDDKGEWHESNSFNRDDLLLAGKLLDQAHTVIQREEQSERQREREAA